MPNNKSSNALLIVYSIFAILELISIQFELNILHHIVKPLLMPALLWYYWQSVKMYDLSFEKLVTFSLIFSWLGDVLLMYQQLNFIYFMFGLGSFMIAHIFYIVIYVRYSDNKKLDKVMRPRLARYDFFILFIWLSFIIILYPVLGGMKIPVVIYSVTITGMALTALHRFQKTSLKSFWMVMIGAMVFMFSDSMIAINKFLDPIPSSGILIMTTYLVAQYLIISGLLAHQKVYKS